MQLKESCKKFQAKHREGLSDAKELMSNILIVIMICLATLFIGTWLFETGIFGERGRTFFCSFLIGLGVTLFFIFKKEK